MILDLISEFIFEMSLYSIFLMVIVSAFTTFNFLYQQTEKFKQQHLNVERNFITNKRPLPLNGSIGKRMVNHAQRTVKRLEGPEDDDAGDYIPSFYPYKTKRGGLLWSNLYSHRAKNIRSLFLFC